MGSLERVPEFEEDELELCEDAEDSLVSKDQTECGQFLDSMQGDEVADTSFFKLGEEDESAPEGTTADNYLAGVPDRDLIEELLEKPAVLEPFGSEQARSARKRGRQGPKERTLPSTLREALTTKGCMFNSIFRLRLRLRSLRGGLDSGFLKNGQNTRKAAS